MNIEIMKTEEVSMWQLFCFYNLIIYIRKIFIAKPYKQGRIYRNSLFYSYLWG